MNGPLSFDFPSASVPQVTTRPLKKKKERSLGRNDSARGSMQTKSPKPLATKSPSQFGSRNHTVMGQVPSNFNTHNNTRNSHRQMPTSNSNMFTSPYSMGQPPSAMAMIGTSAAPTISSQQKVSARKQGKQPTMKRKTSHGEIPKQVHPR